MPARRRRLTPEQRRLLGTPRARDEEATPRRAPEVPRTPPPYPRPVARALEHSPRAEGRSGGGERHLNKKKSRVLEMQRALVAIGILIVLGLTFFVGMKFPYWKYRLSMARNAPTLDGTPASKYAGVSSAALVKEGLRLQRNGNFQGAAERFLAAKFKNREYRGILARTGRIAYEQKDYTTADKLFERAIAFGENIDVSNYFRGLIAVRRKDLPAARRFFEAAVAAEPFVADYHFYLGEALRLDHHPRDSVASYEHAALLARNEGEARICRFKIRMALLEAADTDGVKADLELMKGAGKLSVDWLLTAAAIDLREGRLDEALPLIRLARDGGEPDIFAACITDSYYTEAAHKQPRVAEVSQVPSG